MDDFISSLAKPFKWTHEYLNMVLSSGKSKILSNPILIDAFNEVDRADFVPKKYKNQAYVDMDIPIGWGEKLPSPTVTATMLQMIDIKKGGRYLEVGAGSGYTACIIGTAIGKRGEVISIERNQFLSEIAKINISRYPFLKNVKIVLGDGKNGLPQSAPFDGIIVGASFDEVPEIIQGQLKIGGKLIVPTTKNELKLIERKSVKTFSQTLHKTFFFAKIKDGIV